MRDDIPIIATIMSVGEPQLEHCLISLTLQQRLFDDVIHVRDVSPSSAAYNKILDALKDRGFSGGWMVLISGDMVLYPDICRRMFELAKDAPINVGSYHYGLWDPFLGQNICCLKLQRIEAYGDVYRSDALRDDVENDREVRAHGWKQVLLCEKHPKIPGLLGDGEIGGTHFQNPDEFQVFRRFRVRGAKDRLHGNRKRALRKLLKNLHNKHGNPLHQLAIDAFDYGLEHDDLDGQSLNVGNERRIFSDFLRERQ